MSVLVISSLLLLLLWPACYALLRYSERYTLNRFLLVLAMVAVCAMPFVSLESPAPVISRSLQGTIAYVEQSVTPLPVAPAAAPPTEVVADLPVAASGNAFAAETTGLPGLGTIYLIGLGLALLLLTVRLLFILSLHRRSRPANDGAYRLLHPGASSGQAFTFGPYVYFSEDVARGGDFDHALAHEQVHARQAHSIDIVLSELFLCLFWFHPAAWWLRAQLRANLEYLVDQVVLQTGADKRNYQLALVRQSQANYGLALALPFSEPSLKGRIERMTGLPRYRLIGLVAAAALTLWMGVAALLVNGNPDPEPQLLVSGSVTAAQYEDLLESHTKPTESGIGSFELYFRRLPTPNEFAQIQQILGAVGNTRLSIYHPCEAKEDQYALQLSHWLNVEAQTPFYLREGDLMDHHNVFKLKPNGLGGRLPKVPHVTAGYFTPTLHATVWDENDPFSWHSRGDNFNNSLKTDPQPQEASASELPFHVPEYFRPELVEEEIAVFVNGVRQSLRPEPSIKVNVKGFSITDDEVEVKVNGGPVPTWSKNFFFSWREAEAENGPPPVPANVRMYCLLGMAKNRFGLTINVSFDHSGNIREWVERINIPKNREVLFYLNDNLMTESEVLDRVFSNVDVLQVGYNRLDPEGPVIVQAIMMK